MSTFDCLYSFNPCLMGLGCPLLRGSSDRRLRRCAATPSLTENQNFSTFFSIPQFLHKTRHSLYHCQNFQSAPVKNRLNFVKKSSLSFNCLRKGHANADCPSRYRGRLFPSEFKLHHLQSLSEVLLHLRELP